VIINNLKADNAILEKDINRLEQSAEELAKL
jgi:hypothetical protein